MTHEQKKQVREALIRYIGSYQSQAEAIATLDVVSPSTIAQIKDHNWELLSDRIWYNVARQVGFYCGTWQAADTSAHLLLRILFNDAQHYGMAYGIAIGHGMGKTFTAAKYARENSNVIYLTGSDSYNRKSFLKALLCTAGQDADGTAPAMLAQLVALIKEKEQPLLVIDDAHKLKDRVLLLLVLLANSVAGTAGIIMMGDASLRMRIVEGMRMQRPGFDEIYKTIGRRFITLNYLSTGDVPAVCRANGIHDEDTINYITDMSNNCLHTATSLIVQHTQQSMAA